MSTLSRSCYLRVFADPSHWLGTSQRFCASAGPQPAEQEWLSPHVQAGPRVESLFAHLAGLGGLAQESHAPPLQPLLLRGLVATLLWAAGPPRGCSCCQPKSHLQGGVGSRWGTLGSVSPAFHQGPEDTGVPGRAALPLRGQSTSLPSAAPDLGCVLPTPLHCQLCPSPPRSEAPGMGVQRTAALPVPCTVNTDISITI